MVLPIADSDIGGARVRMGFSHGNRRVVAGEHLSAAEVKAIRNRHALQNAGYIECYPVSAVPRSALDRFIVQVAPGKFNVIAGQRLNEAPLTRKAAERLAKA
jgi:hypothetical protein